MSERELPHDEGSDAASIRRALRDGLNASALDMARIATAKRADAAIVYLAALACARMHAIAEAEAWLARLDMARIDDRALAVEAWSLAGRIAKERYAASRARSPDAAREHARAAIERYRRAFELGGSPYPAVNAATMAMLAGDPALSRSLAQQGLDACIRADEDTHWRHATQGEALLLLGRADEAATAYAQAATLARGAYGDIASMRRQLRLIGTPAARRLLAFVPAPAVVAFSGHMIDAPDRPQPRFPASLENEVALALRAQAAAYRSSIGFSQAACGADILFLEAMQDMAMQTHVVIPCAMADFVATSVAFAGERWVERFHRALGRATSVVLATEEPLLGDTVLFEHASNLIRGMATLRAGELETEPVFLAVCEPDAPAHEGGTRSTMDAWRRAGRRVETIALPALRQGTGNALEAASFNGSPREARAARSLKSLLFADVKGFSRMPEQYTPRFAEIFLGTCKRLLDALERPAIDANTRGDGVYLVFERPGDAASYAIALQRALGEVDWTTLGMSHDTAARVGLHTGPVFETFDPVMGKRTFYGTHVNRAARLEPVAQPGHVFATEAFAASLVADGDDRFACRYIGAMPLAKQFGEARLYRVVADGEAACTP